MGLFDKPTAYEYIDTLPTMIIFIIKSANRAVVETRSVKGIEKRD
jgi:hypothetical protein